MSKREPVDHACRMRKKGALARGWRLAVIAAAAAAWVGGGSAVYADPVRVVTSGTVYQLPEDGETGFRLQGSGFSLSNGEALFSFVQSCSPCEPGTTLNLSATATPRQYSPGTATVDGITYNSVFFGGNFGFEAGSVLVPTVDAQSSVTRSAPFLFTGTLSGYENAGQSGAPLFTLQLTGGGSGTATFFGSGAGVRADGISYDFEEAAPTPEPASLLLIGTGIAALAARRRARGERVE